MKLNAERDEAERASIDGRVALAIAAALAGGGLIALVDRIGAPERLVAALAVLSALAGLAAAGLFLRTMRISRFYAAARAIPAPYAALGFSGLGLALFMPFAPPAGDSLTLAALLFGFGGGLALAALVTGPLLRRTGAFSLADFLAARFESRICRLALATLATLVGALVGLAGVEGAVSGLSLIAGVGRPAAAALLILPLALVGAPGGLAGVAWTAAGAGALTLAAYAVPLVRFALADHLIAAPVLGDGDAFRIAFRHIAAWQGETGGGLAAGLGLALGVATLAPLLAPLVGVRDGRAALRAGAGGLIWTGAIGLLIAAAVATSALALIDAAAARRPDRLPEAIYAASATRLVGLCGHAAGRPQEALAACQARGKTALTPADIEPRGLFLLTAAPPLGGLGAADAGLVWAAQVALALALAAAGLLSSAGALGHDAFYRLRDSGALTSRRLAVTRAAYVGATLAAVLVAGAVELDAHLLLGAALALCAAAAAPVLILAFWPRVLAPHALAALATGLVVMSLAQARGAQTLTAMYESASWGFLAALTLGAAFALSDRRPHADARARAGAFVAQTLRRGDAVPPDKGA